MSASTSTRIADSSSQSQGDQPWSDAVGYRSEYDGLNGSIAGPTKRDEGDSSFSKLEPNRTKGFENYEYATSSTVIPESGENLITSIRKRRALSVTGTEEVKPTASESSSHAGLSKSRALGSEASLGTSSTFAYAGDADHNPWADVPSVMHHTASDYAVPYPAMPVGFASGTPKVPKRTVVIDIPPGLEREAEAILVNDGMVRETQEMRDRWKKEWEKAEQENNDHETKPPALPPRLGEKRASASRSSGLEEDYGPHGSSGPTAEKASHWQMDEDPWKS